MYQISITTDKNAIYSKIPKYDETVRDEILTNDSAITKIFNEEINGFGKLVKKFQSQCEKTKDQKRDWAFFGKYPGLNFWFHRFMKLNSSFGKFVSLNIFFFIQSWPDEFQTNVRWPWSPEGNAIDIFVSWLSGKNSVYQIFWFRSCWWSCNLMKFYIRRSSFNKPVYDRTESIY